MARLFSSPSSSCGVPGCPLCGPPQPPLYAPGGLVSAPLSYPVQPPGNPSPGMEGFSSREFEPAAGVVTGVRWWGLPAPALTLNPLTADRCWPRELLYGARAAWGPGLNEAACLQGFTHPVPCEPCADGFWAFWREQPYNLGGGLPVLGVIEGSGRVLSGELGFRAQRARIVALHLNSLPLAGWPGAGAWRQLGSGLYVQEAEPEPLFPPDWLDAWRAVISDRLEQLYPGARVYENKSTMLKVHPPDAPPPEPEPPRVPCPWCTARMTATELAAHAHWCPLRLL